MTAFGAVRHLNRVAFHLRANQLVVQSSACSLRLCWSFSSGVQQYWPVPCISCDVVSLIQLLRLCSTGPPHQIPAVHELPSSALSLTLQLWPPCSTHQQCRGPVPYPQLSGLHQQLLTEAFALAPVCPSMAVC